MDIDGKRTGNKKIGKKRYIGTNGGGRGRVCKYGKYACMPLPTFLCAGLMMIEVP